MDLSTKLSQDGYAELPGFFAAEDTRKLLAASMQTRPFDQSLFLSEAEWESSGKSHKHTNPGPGFNVLEKLPAGSLGFIEASPQFKGLMTGLLGENYSILHKRLVCRMPWSNVPDWFRQQRFGKANNALGAFIKKPYRDISYYLDVDMHQDIHDYLRMPPESRNPHYITFYVYLDDVTEAEAPIQLIPGSHRFGATAFQHDLHHTSGGWVYKDKGRTLNCELKTLTGKAGYAALWHSCMLHGTPPVEEGHFRLSLRYLVGRGNLPAACGIDEVEKHIEGPLFHDHDVTPGANASPDGFWNLKMSDYLQYSYRNLLKRA